MCRCKKAVKSYIYSCRAREERVWLQQCDRLFSNHDQRRFTIPRRSISHHKLSVGGKIITDKPQFMHCWTQHFTKLSSSQLSSDAFSILDHLNARSFAYPKATPMRFIVSHHCSSSKRMRAGGHYHYSLFIIAFHNQLLTSTTR